MRRWAPVVASSVVAAAFIGPGTIATATRAGAEHGASLLWALLAATVVCWLLQEAAARSTVESGRPLGEVLRERFGAGSAAARAVAGAVILGCAAYEAGNILGGVAGARLVLGLPSRLLTAVCVLAAAWLLSRGGRAAIQAVLSGLVAVMGAAFVVTAVAVRPDPAELLPGLLVPSVPSGGLLLALALVGTTVVPYNLFLGSGAARGQSRAEMRLGLAVVVGLGGLVSMAVLVVGAAAGQVGFEAVAAELAERLGAWARWLFALGLFAAGFTSALTAPLAAQLTADGLLQDARRPEGGEAEEGERRGVALGVLGVGAVFGLAEASPLPVIVLAQALNGLLLPVVAVALWGLVGERRPDGARSDGPVLRVALGVAVLFTLFLGARGVAASLGRFVPEAVAWAVAVLCVVAVGLLGRSRTASRP